MELSVIIPIYKAEDTLNRCVDSVLRQDVQGMEVILVDDGSPDRCGDICDEWAAKDMRVRVIHQRNMGVSMARNAALDIAQGEYVTFVDSDDCLSTDTLAPLMAELREHTETDIIEYAVRYEGFEHYDRLLLPERTFASAIDYWHETMGWNHCYMCNKIFRRSLFDGIRFEVGRRLEDMLLLPYIYRKRPVIRTTQHGDYIYICNPESFSNDTSPRAIYQLLRAEWLAAWRMGTMPWSRNGRNLYYYMCCRVYDILRFSLRDLMKTTKRRR